MSEFEHLVAELEAAYKEYKSESCRLNDVDYHSIRSDICQKLKQLNHDKYGFAMGVENGETSRCI